MGAGASKTARAPLQNELLYKFFEFYSKRDPFLRRDFIEVPYENSNKSLIDFFNDFWGITRENYEEFKDSFPTFEECLGILDIASMRKDEMQQYDESTILLLRKILVYIISATLHSSLHNYPCHSHSMLLDRLEQENQLDSTCFITTNYDLIMDNELKERFPGHLDYGLYYEKEIFEQEKIYLLKIHGSLNWLYCPSCIDIKVTHFEKSATYVLYPGRKCEKCNQPYSTIIVPPSYYKDMNNIFLTSIYRNTERAFKEAEKIVFCGYSFCDADLHIKYLLKKAELHRRENTVIYITNNHQNKTQESKNEEENRYKRFFKNKSNVHYTEYSFRDFSENGLD